MRRRSLSGPLILILIGVSALPGFTTDVATGADSGGEDSGDGGDLPLR